MFVRPFLLASAVCGFFMLFPGGASAQEDKGPPKKANKEKKESEVGDYDGIRAGASSITPPGARGKRHGKGRPAAYWVGFEAREGGATRIFVQLGTGVDVQQWLEGSSLVVHLPKIRTGNRTVARFLDTRYFDTAIRQVRVRSARSRRPSKSNPGHGRGLQLHFDFKNPADVGQASASMQQGADGYTYLYLDFAAGTDLPDAAEPRPSS